MVIDAAGDGVIDSASWRHPPTGVSSEDLYPTIVPTIIHAVGVPLAGWWDRGDYGTVW